MSTSHHHYHHLTPLGELRISSIILHLSLTHAILVVVLPRSIMEKHSFDLNVRKKSPDSDEVAQYDKNIVSSVHVIDIDEFCLHDLKEIVVKLSYGVAYLMTFLIPILGLDYGLHPLTVDADVLELAKHVKDNKIILVYVEHGSTNVDTSIFVTPNKRVAIAVDNHLRKTPIEIDSSSDVNRNPPSSDKGPIVEGTDDPFDDLDEILGVRPMGNFKEVEVDTDNETEEESDESDTEENDTIDVIDYDSFSSDLDDEIDSERRNQLRKLRRIDRRVCSCRKRELTGIPCKHNVAAIYNMSKNGMRVGRCGIVVESRTVIIPPIHKPQIDRPPKKRKKLVDELVSQSCSSRKLSRRAKSVKCSKCENLRHNRKCCKGQGSASQVGGSNQQSKGARQATGVRNISSQAVGSSQQSQAPR
ncbi:mutator type transposase [Tanacetum coccineum]|uniref:Mutator type transposase n=1 Tax=Tanacetum coccineum TaxID=301880 RepID=A0ABQ4ZV62_9ASTR